MKHLKYTFTDSDFDPCIFSLTILPLLNEQTSDIQASINEKCATSVYKKLLEKRVEDISPNELRVLCCCITYCHLICKKEVDADKKIFDECIKYTFSFNKLNSRLCSQIM